MDLLALPFDNGLCSQDKLPIAFIGFKGESAKSVTGSVDAGGSR